MHVKKEEYKKMYERLSPSSPSHKTIPAAFFVGGAICALGQLLLEVYQNAGMSEKDAPTLVSITLILLSVLLTSLRLYGKLAKFAGAGTLVPITGFANAVSSAAIEFKTEGFVLGTCIKMFIIAGPVIVFGAVASVVYGALLLLLGGVR